MLKHAVLFFAFKGMFEMIARTRMDGGAVVQCRGVVNIRKIFYFQGRTPTLNLAHICLLDSR